MCCHGVQNKIDSRRNCCTRDVYTKRKCTRLSANTNRRVRKVCRDRNLQRGTCIPNRSMCPFLTTKSPLTSQEPTPASGKKRTRVILEAATRITTERKRQRTGSAGKRVPGSCTTWSHQSRCGDWTARKVDLDCFLEPSPSTKQQAEKKNSSKFHRRALQ